MQDRQEITGKGRLEGPKGDEPTMIMRLPESLFARLDWLEIQVGMKANWGAIVRHALRLFLDDQEQRNTTSGR